MTYRATVYRILLASPSDVVGERAAISDVAQSWNDVNSENVGAILHPVLWERSATPEMGDRPQALINKQLVENCDVLIGVFRTRLGSETGEAESGTVEEIEEVRKADKPVMLYFSSVPESPASIDVDQLKRLQEFKERYKKLGLIGEYDSIPDLETKVFQHITSTIHVLHSPTDEEASEPDQADDRLGDLQTFKANFGLFLRRLQAEWRAERESEPYNLDAGKAILELATSEVLDFRAQIEADEGTSLSRTLDEAAKRMKAIQRHRLYLDGGQSLKQFWEEADEIIGTLNEIPKELDRIIASLEARDLPAVPQGFAGFRLENHSSSSNEPDYTEAYVRFSVKTPTTIFDVSATAWHPKVAVSPMSHVPQVPGDGSQRLGLLVEWAGGNTPPQTLTDTQGREFPRRRPNDQGDEWEPLYVTFRTESGENWAAVTYFKVTTHTKGFPEFTRIGAPAPFGWVPAI